MPKPFTLLGALASSLLIATSVVAGDLTIEERSTRERLTVAGAPFDYDNPDWIERVSNINPGVRWYHAMAYDSARAQVVLFGGGGNYPNYDLGDTWVWNGATWTQRSPVTSPTARWSHAMAYDSARARTVLFGGRSQSSSDLFDTWEWDGTNWTMRAAASMPPQRSYHAMAYDAARARVVLFGGHNGAALGDTWEWDGNTWLVRNPVPSPPARAGHAMAYDSLRQRVVLFGGKAGTADLGDTWEWDGNTWEERTPASGPVARYDVRMAYDVSRGRVVLFGGFSHVAPFIMGDTWEWDGNAWILRTPATNPPNRDVHAMAYDSARSRVVMFGGAFALSDTWEYGQITGCGNGNQVISFSPGTGTASTSASNTLGIPDNEAVPLGLGGSVVLRFDHLIGNGPGTDLIVHENGLSSGAINENYRVDVSEDGFTYVFLGDCLGDACQLDLAAASATVAGYVRITDLPPQEPGSAPPNLGADIDAVVAVHCAVAESCNDVDDDGNGSVDEGCDDDGDGYCDANMITVGSPAVCLNGGGDCDDQRNEVHPQAPEACDGLSNNCSSPSWPSVPPNELDSDGDHFVTCTPWGGSAPGITGGGDCDDTDVVASPIDEDGDGLSNCWEVKGVDADGNGSIDLFLRGSPYFADPHRKDVFVEIDYMSCFDPTTGLPGDYGCPIWLGSHWDRPSDEALQAVVRVFRDHGVVLHYIIDEALPHENDLNGHINDAYRIAYGSYVAPPIEVNGFCDAAATDPNSVHFGSVSDRTSSNCRAVITAKSWVFRYALFIHDSCPGPLCLTQRVRGLATPLCVTPQDTSCPVVQTPDGGFCAKDIFFVSMQEAKSGAEAAAKLWHGSQWESYFDDEWADYQAGSFMHELGHTLGLGHGGGDGTNCKPNYLSVMSYSREQNTGGRARNIPGIADGTPVRLGNWLNYSEEALAGLSESSLNESIGVGGVISGRAIYGPPVCASVTHKNAVGPAGTNPQSNQSYEIDWDDDGAIDQAAVGPVDINRVCDINCGSTGSTEQLGGYNDWPRVLACIPLPRPAFGTFGASFGLPTLAAPPEMTVSDYFNAVVGQGDADSDGVGNSEDVCPLVADPAQADGDADEQGDQCDCLPSDANEWDTPSQVPVVEFQDTQTFAWSAPVNPGSNNLVFEVLRSGSPAGFLTSFQCLADSNAADQLIIDNQTPAIGYSYFYLVRAKSGCPNGRGSVGTNSSDLPRAAGSCSP